MYWAKNAFCFKPASVHPPYLSAPPRVRLIRSFGPKALNNAIAAARSCYSPQLVEEEEVAHSQASLQQRDRLAQSTFRAGHHTLWQHAHFQFAIENISRQALWCFFHAHPFYNSEQVSQRYVHIKPENMITPALPPTCLNLWHQAVQTAMEGYSQLCTLLLPVASEAFFRVFPARKAKAPQWQGEIQKKAQEAARYVLPLGTLAQLYHTVSALTLHRYARICQHADVPAEVAYVVQAMLQCVRAEDAEFFNTIEDPLPLDQTPEWPYLASGPHARLGTHAFLEAFDAELDGLSSRLVGFSPQAPTLLAEALRTTLGLCPTALPNPEAWRLLLSPEKNPLLTQTLNLDSFSHLGRCLLHAHYSFKKKLSHAADSQNQRHRTLGASRPWLHTHFVPGHVDIIVPNLIKALPQAEEAFYKVANTLWHSIEALLEANISPETALLLLPNAFPIRFVESGALPYFKHKWTQRLCYLAQEEIWQSSKEEVLQLGKIHPQLAQWMAPPCTLRKWGGLSPLCPEGARFCGIHVWELPLEAYKRQI
ncbi:MAG: FAD-dependent thymidylate synthase [Cystobacterineae bacterium]|nr:FAD-dependent thymidylate synthase [Cystobacterineae bacterium]